MYKVLPFRIFKEKILVAGWSSPVARQAHNLKVVSSNLAPATNIFPLLKTAFKNSCFDKQKAAYYATLKYKDSKED